MTEQRLMLALLAISAGLAADLAEAIAFVDAQLAGPARVEKPGDVIGERHELVDGTFRRVEVHRDGSETEVQA